MLDIVEYQRKKKKLLDIQKPVTSISELQEILTDLEYVCANERSSELVKLLEMLIETTKNVNDSQKLFRLYLLYFQQIYFYTEYSKKAEEVIIQMEKINEKNNKIEQEAFINISKSLTNQFHSRMDDAINFASKAVELITPYKNQYDDTYHRILYVYTLFSWTKNHNFPDAISNTEDCIQYWYSNYNSQAMIFAIFQLLRIYSFLGDDEKIKGILDWVFDEEQIQNNLIDTHYILLYLFTGQIYTIRMRTREAIELLTEAHKKISNSRKTKLTMMYEYTEIIRLLSRCYAYVGNFQQSYDLIMELLSFMEEDYVKRNYFEYGYKRLQFNSYYTLLFIFVQLDLNISGIQDNKLQKIHQYVKSLLEKSNISKNLLLDTSLDEKQMRDILRTESRNPLELYVSLYQHLSSVETYSATEKTIDNIKIIRDFTHNPLYADVILGKIYLSIGKYDEFQNIVDKIKKIKIESEIPVLKPWVDLFVLLQSYLEKPEDQNLVSKFSSLEGWCTKNNFRKMAEEVKLYRKLITSTKTLESFSERFKQTAFLDIYNNQSKKLVLEYLENEV